MPPVARLAGHGFRHLHRLAQRLRLLPRRSTQRLAAAAAVPALAPAAGIARPVAAAAGAVRVLLVLPAS